MRQDERPLGPTDRARPVPPGEWYHVPAVRRCQRRPGTCPVLPTLYASVHPCPASPRFHSPAPFLVPGIPILHTLTRPSVVRPRHYRRLLLPRIRRDRPQRLHCDDFADRRARERPVQLIQRACIASSRSSSPFIRFQIRTRMDDPRAFHAPALIPYISTSIQIHFHILIYGSSFGRLRVRTSRMRKTDVDLCRYSPTAS